MASITVRNLEDGLKRKLRVRAAQNGNSMEQEARDILRAALDDADDEIRTGRDLFEGHSCPLRAARRRRARAAAPHLHAGTASV